MLILAIDIELVVQNVVRHEPTVVHAELRLKPGRSLPHQGTFPHTRAHEPHVVRHNDYGVVRRPS
jgi:hypothetical protein